MKQLTTVRIKYDDGHFSDLIPIGIFAKNVNWSEDDGDSRTLVDVIGANFDQAEYPIQSQINLLSSATDALTQDVRDAKNAIDSRTTIIDNNAQQVTVLTNNFNGYVSQLDSLKEKVNRQEISVGGYDAQLQELDDLLKRNQDPDRDYANGYSGLVQTVNAHTSQIEELNKTAVVAPAAKEAVEQLTSKVEEIKDDTNAEIDVLKAQLAAMESTVPSELKTVRIPLQQNKFKVFSDQVPTCWKKNGIVMICGSVTLQQEFTFSKENTQLLVGTIPEGFRPYEHMATTQKYNGINNNTFFLDCRKDTGNIYIKYPDLATIPAGKYFNLDTIYIAEDVQEATKETLSEIAGARIGFNAVEYNTLGEAIREQMSLLQDNIRQVSKSAAAANQAADKAILSGVTTSYDNGNVTLESDTENWYEDYTTEAHRLRGTIALENETNLNNLINIENYYADGPTAATLVNSPISTSFGLTVEWILNSNTYIRQTLRSALSNSTYFRLRLPKDSSYIWTEWENSNTYNKGLYGIKVLTQNIDLNDITEIGEYTLSNSNMNVGNFPIKDKISTDTGTEQEVTRFVRSRLTVEKTLSDGNQGYIRQTIKPFNDDSFWTRRTTDLGWSSWKCFAPNAVEGPNYYTTITNNGSFEHLNNQNVYYTTGKVAQLKFECKVLQGHQTGWVVVGSGAPAPIRNMYWQFAVGENPACYRIRITMDGTISLAAPDATSYNYTILNFVTYITQ